MKLGNFNVLTNAMPYIIAEIGVNHEGSLDKAFRMIEDAASAGANAVKFQTYTADKIAAKDSPAYWDLSMEPTTSQYKLFKKHDKFTHDDYIKCKKCCDAFGIDFLSTAFDLDALAFIDNLVPFHKVSSSDISNIPFLRAVARTNKPVIISTGASDYNDVDIALKELCGNGAIEVGLLHCILNYPTPYANSNLLTIQGLASRYPNHVIGLSDHSIADPLMLVLSTAFCLGARIIEKHYTFDKSIAGSDHKHSMDKDDLALFVRNLSFIAGLLGDKELSILPEEVISRKNARRSIFSVKALPRGHVITESDLICKRPAKWLSAAEWDNVVGRTLLVDVEEAVPICYSMLSP